MSADIVERLPFGWVILAKNDTVAAFRPRIDDMFGAVCEQESFDAEDVARLDREWAGLAPHRLETLYAAEAVSTALAERAAVPAQVALTTEHHIALREAHCHADLCAYFEPRPVLDGATQRQAFEAGFTRGFDRGAALTAQPAAGEGRSGLVA